MLSLKITAYLADFKNIEKQSRIDIIFLLIFFILLFIPMSKINQDKKSEAENRNLAVYKPFIKHGKINYNFGKDYNEWFSDRFNLRKDLIKLHSSLLIKLTGRTDKGIIDKDNGFLYLNFEFKHHKSDVLKKNIAEIYRLNDFCNDNNIKLYVLITPQKTDIYKTNKSYIKENSLHEDFINYVNEIKKEGKLKLIYPYEPLLEGAKENYMFFKTEHHWTDDGAFIGYKELMKEIKKDFQFVKEVTANDYEYFYNKKIRGDFDRKFHFGTSCRRIGVYYFAKKYHKDSYRYYKHKNFDNLKVETIIKHPKMQKEFYYPNGADLKAVMLGTSQHENLTEFIPFTFKYTKRLRIARHKDAIDETHKYIKYYKQEILDFKPDILIYCIIYSMLDEQYNLFLME